MGRKTYNQGCPDGCGGRGGCGGCGEAQRRSYATFDPADPAALDMIAVGEDGLVRIPVYPPTAATSADVIAAIETATDTEKAALCAALADVLYRVVDGDDCAAAGSACGVTYVRGPDGDLVCVAVNGVSVTVPDGGGTAPTPTTVDITIDGTAADPAGLWPLELDGAAIADAAGLVVALETAAGCSPVTVAGASVTFPAGCTPVPVDLVTPSSPPSTPSVSIDWQQLEVRLTAATGQGDNTIVAPTDGTLHGAMTSGAITDAQSGQWMLMVSDVSDIFLVVPFTVSDGPGTVTLTGRASDTPTRSGVVAWIYDDTGTVIGPGQAIADVWPATTPQVVSWPAVPTGDYRLVVGRWSAGSVSTAEGFLLSSLVAA